MRAPVRVNRHLRAPRALERKPGEVDNLHGQRLGRRRVVAAPYLHLERYTRVKPRRAVQGDRQRHLAARDAGAGHWRDGPNLFAL